MPIRAHSRGWDGPVLFGSGQARTHARLVTVSRRHHPSRRWHQIHVRDLGPWPSQAWRELQRLRSLGVIALKTVHGRHGVVRFTFGVHRFTGAFRDRRRTIARMSNMPRHRYEHERLPLPLPIAGPAPPRPSVPGPTFDEQMTAAGIDRSLFLEGERAVFHVKHDPEVVTKRVTAEP
jgi:hypothetical protein